MKIASFLFGLVISFVALFFVFQRIDWLVFLSLWQQLNYFYIALVLLVILFGVYIRALRWQWLLLPIKKVNSWQLFVATIIGYMGNSLLPGRAGEFARAHVLGRSANISRSTCFATIVVERLFDGFSILLLLLFLPLLVDLPLEQPLIYAAFLAFMVYCLLVLLIVAFYFKRGLVVKLLSFLPAKLLHKIVKVFDSLAHGFQTIKSFNQLLVIFSYSFIIWFVTALGINWAVLSLGSSIAYSSAIFILILLAFAVMVPASPGYVGTYHAAMVYGLVLFGIGKEKSLSIAIIYHGLNFVPIILLGLVFVWRYNIAMWERVDEV